MVTRSFSQSLRFALAGLWTAFSTQRNMRIHGLAALMAFAGAKWLGFSLGEYALLSIIVALVLVAEIFNSALETTLDIITTNYHPQVRRAKNMAAGAVLLTALNALVVGAVLFGRRLIALWIRF